jgi:hypothetical protein
VTVDVVALVLAVALGVAIIGLMTAVIISVVDNRQPIQTLGENTTQVVTAIVGGLIGVLGSYIGSRIRGRNGNGGDRLPEQGVLPEFLLQPAQVVHGGPPV